MISTAMRRIVTLVGVTVVLTGCSDPPTPAPTPPIPPFVVFEPSGVLGSGLDIFVNTDQGQVNWLGPPSDGRLAAYPSGQQFGFVAAVVAGNSNPGSRIGRDLSMYTTLQFELRGAVGGEVVEVGIKDVADPDDGSETKRPFTLQNSWTSHTVRLTDFTTANLRQVYLLFELVFTGPVARSAYFRNVRYVAE